MGLAALGREAVSGCRSSAQPRLEIWHYSRVSHDDNVRRMGKKFSGSSRYANFGPALQSMEVHGFRGIRGLELTFVSPIAALSGLNGTGKSTIAQLAVCGYRVPCRPDPLDAIMSGASFRFQQLIPSRSLQTRKLFTPTAPAIVPDRSKSP